MTRNERRRIRKLIDSGKSVRCRTIEELTEVQLALKGVAAHVMVLHDKGCSPDVCRCRPEFVVKKLTPENYLEGQEMQRQWARETLS